MQFAAFLLAFAAAAAAAPKTDLGSVVGQRLSLCARTRPDFNECMRDRLQELLPELAQTGIPEVGLPRGEPLEIPEMNIHYRNGNLSADLRVRNVKSWGAAGLRILGVRSVVNDPEVFRFEVDFYQPRVFIEGEYKVDARLLVPIVTKGYFNISMTDVSGTWNVTGEHYEKRGRDHVRISGASVFPDVGDMRIYANNLVPGNPELSDYLLILSNRYWRPIYDQLLPDTNEAWGVFARERANRVFAKVPFDDIFPLE